MQRHNAVMSVAPPGFRSKPRLAPTIPRVPAVANRPSFEARQTPASATQTWQPPPSTAIGVHWPKAGRGSHRTPAPDLAPAILPSTAPHVAIPTHGSEPDPFIRSPPSSRGRPPILQ